jgi:hypothetical protein
VPSSVLAFGSPRFHRLRPEFNGLFEHEEYITLQGIDDPNEGYVDLRTALVWNQSSASAVFLNGGRAAVGLPFLQPLDL